MLRICLPVLATFLQRVQAANRVSDFAGALEELHTQASGDVEGDVAMHEPRAWVVGLEGEDEVAGGGEGGGVAADGVVGLKARDIAGPLGACLLVEDVEIMAVEMDGVREWGRGDVVLLDHPVLPL